MKKLYASFLFLLVSTLSFSMVIYPKEFQKDITKGNYETYSITNDTNEIKIYKIDIDIKDGIESKIFPKVFTLKPNENQNVKVFLNPSSNLKDGAYTGNILIQIIPTRIKELNNLKLNIHMDVLAYINKNPLI
ncbi:MAG: hypothetical protein ACRC6J_02885 [Cetobacterium sp.]|uniref:hypothetical protein n=1 Tax=Cetobacterium sp. TaxID=2071632 RepID=UPI003F4065E1